MGRWGARMRRHGTRPWGMLLVLLLGWLLAACGPAARPPARSSASSAATPGPVAATSSAAASVAPPRWRLVPLPVTGSTGQQLQQVSALTLQPGPAGTLVWSGQPALCCLVAGTLSPGSSAVHVLSAATCGHQCSLWTTGAGLFAGDAVSGTGCGELFYRGGHAWQPVAALGLMCAPPAAAPSTGWTEGVVAAGGSGLWVCLLAHGKTWYLGHVGSAGTLVTARLPAACQGLAARAGWGAIVALRPNLVLQAAFTAAGQIRLSAVTTLPGSPWTGTFAGFPGSLAVGPHGDLWYLATAGGSGRIYRWRPADGAVHSWSAAQACAAAGEYTLAAAGSVVWLRAVASASGSPCTVGLADFSPATASWITVTAGTAQALVAPWTVGPTGGLWLPAGAGVADQRPDGATVSHTRGWPAGYQAESVAVAPDGAIWAAARSGRSGGYRWALLAWPPA